MKKSISIIVTLFAVLLCSKSVNSQNAEPVMGSHLEIGSENVIDDNVICGNAIVR